MVNFPFEALLSDLVRRFPPDVRWAVSCGSALTLHGLNYTPNDLDFFAPREDAYLIADSLKALPLIFPLQLRSSDIYRSYFGRFCVDNVAIDVVGDFSIKRHDTLFLWNAVHPCWNHLKIVTIHGQPISLFSLEDLLLVYVALPNEKAKLNVIANAMQSRGYNRTYLRQLLQQTLQIEEAVFWQKLPQYS
jgi:hypothetical protein